MTSDLAGMMAAVSQMRHPPTFGVDWGAVLIAADAAAEAADCELEAALRWCAKLRRWPRVVTVGDGAPSWHWGRDLPKALDRFLGPGGWADPDLPALLRRLGDGLIALKMVDADFVLALDKLE